MVLALHTSTTDRLGLALPPGGSRSTFLHSDAYSLSSRSGFPSPLFFQFLPGAPIPTIKGGPSLEGGLPGLSDELWPQDWLQITMPKGPPPSLLFLRSPVLPTFHAHSQKGHHSPGPWDLP
jgi:hypothetical protein